MGTTTTKRKSSGGFWVWLLVLALLWGGNRLRQNGQLSNESSVPDRVPESYREHTYMQNLDTGNCEQLMGKVVITAVFVNDLESRWDEAAREAVKEQLAAAVDSLVADAGTYGKTLHITFDYREAAITKFVRRETNNVKDCLEEVMTKLQLPELSQAQLHLEKENGVDENPMVFLLNKEGRAFKSGYGQTEYVLMYRSGQEAKTFRHELLHVYSAYDYYYPKSADSAAEAHLPDSIMNGGEQVDDLTAFHVGWRDTLTENAQAFLADTADVTPEARKAAWETNTTTGTVTDFPYGDGLYTGRLAFGYPNGTGKLVHADGRSYDGQWVHGTRQGKGVYIWANGSRYEGEFVKNMLHGHGVMIFESGSRYEGDWVNGERTGKGTMEWNTGSRYVGDFVDGQMSGYGEMYYSNGDTYKGSWENGKRHGQGTYTWANGKSKTGTWSEGNIVE